MANAVVPRFSADYQVGARDDTRTGHPWTPAPVAVSLPPTPWVV